MSIEALCPECGRLIYAPKEAAGTCVLCPGCGESVRAIESAAPASTDEEAVELACPNCESPLRVIPRLVGLRVRCNTCRATLLVSLSLTPTDSAAPSSVASGIPGRQMPSAKPEESRKDAEPLEDTKPLEDAPRGSAAASCEASVHEAATAFRDLNINTSLRQMVEGPDEAAPIVDETTESPESPLPDTPAAPWFWPSVVAAAATGITLTVLVVIRFVL